MGKRKQLKDGDVEMRNVKGAAEGDSSSDDVGVAVLAGCTAACLPYALLKWSASLGHRRA